MYQILRLIIENSEAVMIVMQYTQIVFSCLNKLNTKN